MAFLPSPTRPTSQPPTLQGTHILCLHHQLLVSMGSCKTIHLYPHLSSRYPSSYTMESSKASNNLVSITFSHRPDEALLFAMVKTCLHSNKLLFLSILKEYFLLLIQIGYILINFCNVLFALAECFFSPKLSIFSTIHRVFILDHFQPNKLIHVILCRVSHVILSRI